MQKKKIVICGSMRFLDQMLEWQQKLQESGYHVEIPTPEDFHSIRDLGDLGAFEEIKRLETKKHFKEIEEADVVLVLK